MKSTTENSLESFKPWKNRDTISRDQDTPLSYFLTQELDVLQNCSKTEWQTSQMVALALRIWHQIDTSTGIKNNSIRCTITKTQSWNRRTTGRRKNGHVTREHVHQPTGYWLARKNIERKRTGYRCEECYGNIITRRTYKSKEQFGGLENRRNWWKEDNILQRKELHC